MTYPLSVFTSISGRYFLKSSSHLLMPSQRVRNILVRLHTASPLIIIAVSFQCPYTVFTLIYSSARLTPPVKPTLPSITHIFLWSLLLYLLSSMLLKVLNSKHLIPAFLKSLTISTGALAMLPRLSYINLTSTPLDAFSLRISRILFSISLLL